MDEDPCSADFIDATIDCELPAGHDGDHRGTLTWPQSDPLPVTLGPAIMGGYAAYMLHRYGEWVTSGMPATMSSPLTAELVRPRRRWWRRA